jgi:tRNA U34 5-methylaminomethyl-2-thiouridine-forming methyltransferase MnmC
MILNMSMNNKVEIERSGDGSDTLYVPALDEHYHSVNGAVTESEWVYLHQGFQYLAGGQGRSLPEEELPPLRVLEIGFGTGLNSLVTLMEAHRCRIPVSYYGIEKYPLPPEVYSCLNYPEITVAQGKEWYHSIHTASWEEPVRISPFFELTKLRRDFITAGLDPVPPCHVVYYDAFAPGKQPEMWEDPLFRKLYDRVLPGGVMVTYCATGRVRRGLMAAGFKVERLPGPPGKREMLRGIRSI